jgi:hypothetical protein
MSARKLWLIIASAFVLGAGALFYAQKAYPETFLLPLSGLPLVPLANLSMPSMPSMPNISAFTDVLPSGAPHPLSSRAARATVVRELRQGVN